MADHGKIRACADNPKVELPLREDGRYRRMEEHQVQRAWDPETLKEILWKAGFRAVCMYSGMTLNAAGEKDQRWHIAATNPAQ